MRNFCRLARPGLALLAILVLPLVLPRAALAASQELDLSLNSDSFRVGYATAVNDALRLEAGFLHDSDDGQVVHAGLVVTGEAMPGSQNLVAGIGGRLAYLDGDGRDREGYALGVGGSVRWLIPRYERFALSGELYWAPNILAGGDAEEYVDSSIRLGYSVTRRAEIYVGARYLRVDYDQRPSVNFDTGMHAGFNLRF